MPLLDSASMNTGTLPIGRPAAAPCEAEALARLYKAAGDALRVEVLRALKRDSFGVLELCRMFGVRQPAMSHHLKVLADAGLVCRRREGTSIFYRRARHSPEDAFDEAIQAVYAAVDRVGLREATLRGVSEVQSERSASSLAFFAANADKFAVQQELIAPREQYEDHLNQILAELAQGGNDRAVELGPGEGWLLPRLAGLFARVVAIDNSPEMLEKARATCIGAGLGNVSLLLGDSRTVLDQARDADVVVLNMVLHHTPSPAEVIHDVSAALRPGGALVLTDLCSHDQAWAREACGDLWLGFPPEDLSAWALAAGLREGDSIYLALRNGFRVQTRLFHQPD